MMHRCNICGSGATNIVYTSILDGNVCKVCDKTFFTHVDNDIKAIGYNKPAVMKFITEIENTSGYCNAIKALKDIQSRYNYSINAYSINNNILTLCMVTRYKGKEATITLKITDEISEYTLSINGKVIKTRKFK